MTQSSQAPTAPQPEAGGALSAVYGPVRSWRLGQSLGIDLLLSDSICSFRCIYCQLGKIHRPTRQRAIFVPTDKVLADLAASAWDQADVITFSGNGEPTLALNLGECLEEVSRRTAKPTIVLTNATLLGDPAVRGDLARADRVFVKLDAASDRGLAIVDHPVEDPSDTRSPIAGIVDGILAFRRDYRGYMAIQTMVMPANLTELDGLCELYARIGPDEIQLNTPLRPVPRAWYRESRGNHGGPAPVPESHLAVLTREQARAVEKTVRERTGIKVVSVYQPE